MEEINPFAFNLFVLHSAYFLLQRTTVALANANREYFLMSAYTGPTFTTQLHEEIPFFKTILTYRINVPEFSEKKPYSKCCEYFWAGKIISIDWLDTWPSVRSKIRNQVNQLKWFPPIKNNVRTLVKVFAQNSAIIPVRLFGRLEYILQWLCSVQLSFPALYC